jgi:acyl-CoA reductase-like NAD-dependent aldehyde dehydrogenase
VTHAQQRKVLDYIAIGLKEGARIAAQAKLPTSPRLADGFFVPPTLFVDVTETMTIANEEIFGPVSCVLKFDAFEDAIRIANATPFGLSPACSAETPKRRSGRRAGSMRASCS